jgi:hypothetical protein
MTRVDPDTNNLFSRVFRYSGHPERERIEDFCTEALAWCLRKSRNVQKRFLNLVGNASLADCDAALEIQTQQSFKPSLAEEANDESDILSGGRFDLVIESQTDPRFAVVVESKVASGFGKNQLPGYRRQLNDPDSFPGVEINARFLVTLTTLGEKAEETDANLKWSDVQPLLALGQPDDEFVDSTVKQFAEFLEQKGLGPMKLQKVTPELLQGWSQIKALEDELRTIIEKLRVQKAIKAVIGRKQVKSADAWIGVGGRYDFWAGFGICQIDKDSELFMWVEITLPGDRRMLSKSLPDALVAGFNNAGKYVTAVADTDSDKEVANFGKLWEGKTRFVFVQPVSSNYNGNPDVAFTWLLNACLAAIDFSKTKPSKSR